MRGSRMPGAAEPLRRGRGRARARRSFDSLVAAAFDAHQRRLTGRGRLLGPNAGCRRCGSLPRSQGQGARPAECLAARGPRGRPCRRRGSPGGSEPPASSRQTWPPQPALTRPDAWRRRAPVSSRSLWATPISWCFRDDRARKTTGSLQTYRQHDDQELVGAAAAHGCRRGAHRRRLAAGGGSLSRRHPGGGRHGVGRRSGDRGGHDCLLCLALDGRGARTGPTSLVPSRRRRLLPVGLSQPCSPGRGCGRRPPRGPPRA